MPSARSEVTNPPSNHPATTLDRTEGGLEPLTFTETVTLPVPPGGAAVPEALHRVLDLLHVVAGVSYFKVGAPLTVLTIAMGLAWLALMAPG